MLSLIDTHTHLFVDEFNEDHGLMLIRAAEAGVLRMYVPNIDDCSVTAMLALCDANENCFPLIGLHPTSVDDEWKQRLDVIKNWLISGRKFWGIGEVGLDLYWDTTYKTEQMQAFDEQIQWALQYDLPLSIHCRNAFPELFDVIEPYRGTNLRGIFHSFTGSEAEAEALLSYEGFMLGVNGVVTFKNSNLPVVLKSVPLSRVVLETDSPYLSPVPYRGKRNESAYLVKVAEKLAEVYECSLAEVSTTTTKNAQIVFGRG